MYLDAESAASVVLEDAEQEEGIGPPSRQHDRQSESAAVERKRQQLLRNQHLKQETVRVIESLLEGAVPGDSLKKSLSLLCKADYDDLNTERSLAMFCGYPLCGNTLQPVAHNPQRKFQLDIKKKKVFRMAERMLFCSAHCLESSAFLKDQLSDEALWLRYKDSEGFEPLYRQGAGLRFMTTTTSTDCDSVSGVQHDSVPYNKKLSTKESVSFPYIKQEHIVQLQNAVNCLTIKERTASAATAASSSSSLTLLPLETTGDMKQKDVLMESGMHVNQSAKEDSGERSSNRVVTSVSACSTTATDTPAPHLAADLHGNLSRDARQQVMRVLTEWLQEEALLFILGEREFDAKAAVIRQRLLNDSLAHEDKRKRKLEESIEHLIQRLDQQDLLEDLLGQQEVLSHSPESETKYVKAADEIRRQEEGEKGTRKAGFKSRRSTGPDGTKKRVTFAQENRRDSSTAQESQSSATKTEERRPIMPVSSHSPAALRRQIAFDQLHQSLMSSFSAETAARMFQTLKPLFYRLNLTPVNVSMAPNEWTLASLFLLHFMEVRARLANQRSAPDDGDCDDEGREKRAGDHEDLLSLQNNEQVARLQQSFYSHPEEWKEKVDLFLFQTRDVA